MQAHKVAPLLSVELLLFEVELNCKDITRFAQGVFPTVKLDMEYGFPLNGTFVDKSPFIFSI